MSILINDTFFSNASRYLSATKPPILTLKFHFPSSFTLQTVSEMHMQNESKKNVLIKKDIIIFIL